MDAKLSGTDDESSPAILLPGSLLFFQAAYNVVFVSLWVHTCMCTYYILRISFGYSLMSFVQ